MAIDVAEVIDRSPISALQVRVIALCALVALFDGYDLQAMAAVTPAVAGDWGLAPGSFGPIIAASLVGLAAGALVAGPMGDRFGRRVVLIQSMVVVGVATLATATAETTTGLFAWRLLTGLGLGASMPNVIALTAESVPARRRTLLVTLMFCGLPLGGSMGGLIAAELLRSGNWPAVFVIGGVAPLITAALLVAFLPESLRFMAARRQPPARVGLALARLVPDYRYEESHVFDGGVPAAKSSLRELFANARAPGTLILWAVFFCNLFALYLLSSWLPTIFRSAGWTMAEALRAAAMFQVGGIVGALVLGRLMDRFGAGRLLPATYTLTAVFVMLISSGTVLPALSVIATTLAGAGVVGCQFCINSLAADAYPTTARATGVGWALGIGRFGAILAPLAGGQILAASDAQAGIFAGAALSLLICAVGVLLLQRTVLRARAL